MKTLATSPSMPSTVSSVAWLCCWLLLSTGNTVGAYKRHFQTVTNPHTSTTASLSLHHERPKRLSPAFLLVGDTAVSRRIHHSSAFLDLSVIHLPRGGASSDSDSEDEDEDTTDDDIEAESDNETAEASTTVEDDGSDSEVNSDEEEEEMEADDEYDDMDEDEEEEESADGVQIDMAVQKYDDPLFPSPFANLYVTFGVMFLARKLDLKSPKAAIIAR